LVNFNWFICLIGERRQIETKNPIEEKTAKGRTIKNSKEAQFFEKMGSF